MECYSGLLNDAHLSSCTGTAGTAATCHLLTCCVRSDGVMRWLPLATGVWPDLTPLAAAVMHLAGIALPVQAPYAPWSGGVALLTPQPRMPPGVFCITFSTRQWQFFDCIVRIRSVLFTAVRVALAVCAFVGPLGCVCVCVCVCVHCTINQGRRLLMSWPLYY